MHPDGRKNMSVTLNRLKIFLQPYFYLMLEIFFREGMPTYDEASIDKPNEYTSDLEECSEIFCKVLVHEVLVCLSSSNNDDEGIIGNQELLNEYISQ